MVSTHGGAERLGSSLEGTCTPGCEADSRPSDRRTCSWPGIPRKLRTSVVSTANPERICFIPGEAVQLGSVWSDLRGRSDGSLLFFKWRERVQGRKGIKARKSCPDIQKTSIRKRACLNVRTTRGHRALLSLESPRSLSPLRDDAHGGWWPSAHQGVLLVPVRAHRSFHRPLVHGVWEPSLFCRLQLPEGESWLGAPTNGGGKM